MTNAILRAFQTIRERLTDTEIVRAIQSGVIDNLFEKELSQAMFAQAFQPVRDQMRQSVNKGALYSIRDLPAPKSRTVNFAFDNLSPDVVQAVKQLESRVITDLETSVRETVRQRVLRGITVGESASKIARDLRNVIGLSPSQEQAVSNYRKALSGEGKNPLDYELRDKRYDKTVARGELTESQIEKMSEAYRRKMLAHNANTVSKTAVLDSQKLGQKLAMDSAVKQGIIDGDKLQKTWVGVMDERERDEHVAMEGETVPYAQPFSNGEMICGESTYNCRCLPRYVTA